MHAGSQREYYSKKRARASVLRGWVTLPTDEIERSYWWIGGHLKEFSFKVGNHLRRLLYLCPERIL